VLPRAGALPYLWLDAAECSSLSCSCVIAAATWAVTMQMYDKGATLSLRSSICVDWTWQCSFASCSWVRAAVAVASCVSCVEYVVLPRAGALPYLWLDAAEFLSLSCSCVIAAATWAVTMQMYNKGATLSLRSPTCVGWMCLCSFA
jgi:hypothetical protein